MLILTHNRAEIPRNKNNFVTTFKTVKHTTIKHDNDVIVKTLPFGISFWKDVEQTCDENTEGKATNAQKTTHRIDSLMAPYLGNQVVQLLG